MRVGEFTRFIQAYRLWPLCFPFFFPTILLLVTVMLFFSPTITCVVLLLMWPLEFFFCMLAVCSLDGDFWWFAVWDGIHSTSLISIWASNLKCQLYLIYILVYLLLLYLVYVIAIYAARFSFAKIWMCN